MYNYICVYLIYVCIIIYVWVYIYIHMHTIKYYSALKRKEILTHCSTWMKLEDIMLREISQSQKDTLSTSLSCIPHILIWRILLLFRSKYFIISIVISSAIYIWFTIGIGFSFPIFETIFLYLTYDLIALRSDNWVVCYQFSGYKL